ncbi:MAG: signal peptide protein [Betaproteobacteria bacterium]|jgi:quercetin dioxygenase-like cupin family protein|nr:signal peptide protein [Betaproteobacteria bacterium]
MRFAATVIACVFVAYAHAEEVGVLRKMPENKFVSVPGLPSCITQAVESGDPTKGPSVILFKGKAGCLIPWHWHTPTEHVMVVSGSVKVQMRVNGGSAALGPGGYAMMPGKHVHQFTCPSACTGFVSSDAPFDIHYVDAAGKEIAAEAALAKKR